MIAPAPYTVHPLAGGQTIGIFDAQRRIIACLPAITLNPADTLDTAHLLAAAYEAVTQLRQCDTLLIDAARNCAFAGMDGTAAVLTEIAARNRNIVKYSEGKK